LSDKIYIGFSLDQLNLIHQLLEYELDKDKDYEYENEDYHNLLKSSIEQILKEV
jgi:hypothetical protein